MKFLAPLQLPVRFALLPALALAATFATSTTAVAAPPPPDAGMQEAEEAPPEDGMDEGLDPGLEGDPAGELGGEPPEADPLAEPEPEPEPEPDADAEASASVELNGLPEGPDEEKGTPPGALPPRHRITYLNLIAARYNPLGLEERLWIGYQRRLYDKADPLWNQSNIAAFGNVLLSPAIARIGATLQYQPLSILRFRATYGYQGWFGTFQYMRSYDSPYAEHSETQLGLDADRGNNYAAGGHQVELGGLFQVKVGPIAIRSNTNVYYNAYNLEGQNDVFYDVRIDALVPNNGWSLLNDSDVLYLADMGLLAGARATTTKAFFPKGSYEPGETREDPNGPMFRVGPVIGYQFFDRPGSKFNKPLILLLAQWHVKHRYRTGLDVNQGIPTLALAFKFEGDLWKKDDK